MKIHYCKCCDYSTKYKSHYEKHLISKKHEMNAQKFVHMTQKNMNVQIKEIKCLHCEKMFTTKRSMMRHVKTTCKVLKQEKDKEHDKLKSQVERLQNQVDKLSNSPKTINNNHGTINNNNNTIVINDYRKTDASQLTDRDYKHFIKQINKCLPKMIEHMHCNKENPENMNIYLSNTRGNFVKIREDNKWILSRRDDVIEGMINKKLGHIEDWLSTLSDDDECRYRKIYERIENGICNEETKKNIILDMVILLYNNRGLLKEFQSVIGDMDDE